MNRKYKVRWEENGKQRFKEYDDEKTARKALAWIRDRGHHEADLAVTLITKKHETEDENSPVVEQQWYHDM